jgi:hypothetical protein
MGPEELTEVSSAGAVLVSVKVGKLLRSHARALHLPKQIFYFLSQNKKYYYVENCTWLASFLVLFSLVWLGEILFGLAYFVFDCVRFCFA